MSRRLFVLNLGTFLLEGSITAGHATGQTPYTLKPAPKTVAWGHYDEGFWRALK